MLKQFFASKVRMAGLLVGMIGVIIAVRIVLKFYSGQQTITITMVEILGIFFSVVFAAILLTTKAGKPDQDKDAGPD